MATKKNVKKAAVKKAKAPAKGKKITAKAKVVSKKAKPAAPKAKAGIKTQKPVKPKAKAPAKIKAQKPIAVPEHTGPDLHLIPVKGEIHPARINEKGLFENAFHHNEEIALHQEQQRVKASMANRNKKVFFRPRQS